MDAGLHAFSALTALCSSFSSPIMVVDFDARTTDVSAWIAQVLADHAVT